MEWLHQALLDFDIVHVEAGRFHGTKRSLVEVQSFACIHRAELPVDERCQDCPELSIPLKLWTYVNGKPLDVTQDCAVTKSIANISKLSSYFRIAGGTHVGERLCIRAKKARDIWTIGSEKLAARAHILLVVKISAGD